MAEQRRDALSWDDYYMAVAFLSSMRSKDPSTQVGACIVNEDKRIVGIGYNGFPRGCSDDELPWAREAPVPRRSRATSPMSSRKPTVSPPTDAVSATEGTAEGAADAPSGCRPV